MNRPRITTGTLMASVLLVAVALGLSLPAIAVCRDRDLHAHEWAVFEVGKLDLELSGSGLVSPPFLATLLASSSGPSDEYPSYLPSNRG